MNFLNIKGRLLRRTDAGFEAAVLDTLFNKQPLDRMPDLLAEPMDVDDIITVIRYARSAGKKISICSGGHSWSANHVRNDSVLISMTHFNRYEVDKANMRATAGPAVGGSVLLSALMKQDLFFPAGHCKGVCIGGYLLQGGFAWNGRKLGMACESVIGYDIVTAEGELVHASETENADLFWAARGAGGGFFGVVVRFHLRLYPRPKYIG
ncbi:MAG TPA: FAD-dependent oxidoreductase, partial [Saprospiraceae bacterium]|nr:FAD-dependent oxidoreductase [Saprospiraceae bacterium]